MRAIGRWFAARTSLAVTSTSAVLVAALVAAVAVVSGGYDAQRLDLGDGSVWVANGAEQAIGRANTGIHALDTVVERIGTDISLEQDGTTVLLVDRSSMKVDLVDPATASVVESSPLPIGFSDVFLAGERLVIHAAVAGSVWIVPVAELSTFDADSEPTLSLGADSVASIGSDGILYVYSSAVNKMHVVDPATGAVLETTDVSFDEAADSIQLSSVGRRWTLFAPSTGQLSITGVVVDLSDLLDDGAVLQTSSTATGAVLLADESGLVEVPLDGREPVVLESEAGGTPAAPAVVGGCAFAAWSGGLGWRRCAGDPAPVTLTLAGLVADSSVLGFERNGSQVVLNDRGSGGTWAVQDDGESIDNWDELISSVDDPEQVETNTDDTPPQFEAGQVPPVAVDDGFGARPARASVLPVLLNDYDPNGDPLVVDQVTPIDPAVGRLDVINDRQQILVTLAATAAGSVSFEYTVSDGRGGTATAGVTVAVRTPQENSAPAQVRRSSALVAQGGAVTTSTLGDWVDPDGDAFYLTQAGSIAPDTVTFRPNGVVVFQDGGASAARTVSLTMSDGRADGGGQLSVTVRPAGEVPLIADPFVVQAYAGQEITVSPLVHVRGGTGALRLSGVPTVSGARIEASLERGTFVFSSTEVRTHLVQYVANDGDKTVTGTVRIDVAAPPDENSTPVTIPKTVFVKTQSSETVEIATTDIDPAGGVLLVVGVSNIPPGSGIAVDVLDQRAVRVTLTGPLETGPVTFNYTVTNGLASALGVITVVEIALPARFQPPAASDDTATVRAGDAIDIPVLANDVHPDGEELTLNPRLVSGLGRDSGLLFASGSVLRYLAPDRTGNFTVVYEVSAPDGQVDQAEVTISVRQKVAATNSAPVPLPTIARVTAGETVRVRIALTGIDSDGDSVQLLGQDSNPAKGAVTEVGSDYIDYRAGDYSAGTDSFTYRVIDALGARASGTVRVGITPPVDGSRNPIAVADLVTISPGKTVSVQVLANDSDPDGHPLSILSVEPNAPDIGFEIDGDVVTVTPPGAPGRYGLIYTIDNGVGGTSSNFITVVVVADAPLSYPIARDTVLNLADILDRDTINVDVLRNVFFADGEESSLSLSLLPGYRNDAIVTGAKRVQVSVTDERQIIPFAVAHPDDASIIAYAFIWVPGRADALPQLDPTSRPLTVSSGSPLTIDLNDYIIAAGGRSVRLVDSTSVAATRANGDPLVVDSRTLRYTSEDGYFGPASISFEVTDGATANDPDGNRATLVLGITVTPRENQPPVFNGASISFEPGESKTIDLLRLTTYPYPADTDELAYSVQLAPPRGFSYSVTGAVLKITADPGAVKGTTVPLTLGVRDGTAAGISGRIDLSVVASTRPLARPAPDTAIAVRGQSIVVDVLANDEATNPFPATPLAVVAIRGLDAASLPDGVTISPTADRSRLTVTVSASAAPVDTNLQYQVADATGDPSRYAFGTVRISVQDRPDAPVAPARAGSDYEEGLVTLRITAPISNNSPITRYEVVSSSNGSYRADCGTNLRCVLSDLQPGLRYQFSVIATNAVGASASSPLSIPLSADFLPAAPAMVSATATAGNPSGGELRVEWNSVPDPDPGSGVNGYTVRITGPQVDFTTTMGASTTSVTTTAGGSLVANAQYVATVYATNGAIVLSSADWRRTSSSPATTVGPPSETEGGVQVTRTGSSGAIQVTWGASSPNGAASMQYSVGRIGSTDAAPTACATGPENPGVAQGVSAPAASGWTDTATSDGSAYRYVVYSDNGLFCTPTASGSIETRLPPGQATGSTGVEVRDGRFDLRVASVSAGGIVERYEARVGGGGWVRVVPGDWLTSAGDSSVYGRDLEVVYRACRDETVDYCGPESVAEILRPVNARGSIITCQVGAEPQSNPPQNANLPTVAYRYSYNVGGPASVWTEFQEGATVPAPAPAGTGETLVRLKVVVTFAAGDPYEDDVYAEGSCTP